MIKYLVGHGLIISFFYSYNYKKYISNVITINKIINLSNRYCRWKRTKLRGDFNTNRWKFESGYEDDAEVAQISFLVQNFLSKGHNSLAKEIQSYVRKKFIFFC